MEKLVVEFNNQLNMLNLRNKKTYTISDDLDAEVTFKGLETPVFIEQNDLGEWQANHSSIFNHQYKSDSDLKFHYYTTKNTHSYLFPSNDMLTIGSDEYADIQISDLNNTILLKNLRKIHQTQELTIIHDKDQDFYRNYEKIVSETIIARVGDHLFVDGLWIEIREDGVNLLSNHRVQSKLVPKINAFQEQDDDYHRSPRIIHREPTEEIEIQKPPQPVQKNNQAIWRSIIPPMVMIALTVIIFLVRPVGIYILLMVGMSTVTMVFGFTTYFSEKKKYKKEVKKREVEYKKYLKRKSTEIYKAMNEQRFSLNFHYPLLTEIKSIVERREPRTYEKTYHHHDFMHYKLGTSDIDKSFKLNYQEDEFNQRRDDLFDEALNLYQFYDKVEKAPLVNDLIHGPIAYVGPRHLIMEQLQQLLLQLCTFHSYHDLECLMILREDEFKEFKWARWLPHLNLKSLNIRGFVHNQRTRDQILTSIYSQIKERKQAAEEASQGEKVVFTPHLVIMVTEMDWVMDHIILELLNQDLTEYGVSLIFVEEVIESLPEHVKTVIDIKSRDEGELVMKEGELIQQTFVPEQTPEIDKEYIARRLANLNHVEHMKNAIPNSMTFLEMYKVETVQELNIARRWNMNDTYKTMSVPLGMRGKDDILELNLHEKAHGPHGLIAGTTGSGKSEIIQSYILSLSVNFHPHEIAFLLIDYKGGGMANLFKNLPHLVGTITNLDGDEAMRALTSIKAELKKRQRLFGEFDVNHINQYHKLINEGIATEPMPHLFIISDEFAELKSEQPDFMKELVSTARIGRSLGIHLILATQKPSGVVDDQIWSNSKFKLALKVQNRQDSNEILKTPDAADIKEPGRAYLQVGNNEIYELFQSAFSGADYEMGEEHLDNEDRTIYLINDYGQMEPINKDLSGLDNEGYGSQENKQTELEAVIEEIDQINNDLAIEQVKRPWLPPLPENVYQGELVETNFKVLWEDAMSPAEVTLGLKDVPEDQFQGPLTLKLNEAGHIAVIGSPGYGRTTFLHNTIFDLARHHRPDQAHMYLFDFGTNGLMPVVDVPHVADYFTVDQEAKIAKAMKRINQIIAERKQLLSQKRVVNIDQYNRTTDAKVPNVFIFIDNYDAVKEVPFKEEFEELMGKITREGLALSIYVILTGSRSSAIKTAIFTNIKTRVALYLFDNNELTNIIGSYKKGVKDIKGRAAINDDNFTQFQVAQPYRLDADDSYNDLIKNEVALMNEAFVGDLPKAIPMMPDKVTKEKLEAKIDITNSILENHRIPIGLDFEEVEPVCLDLTKPSIITGKVPTDIEQLNQQILTGLEVYKDQHTVLMLDSDGNMSDKKDKVTSYYHESEELQQLRQGFKVEIAKRKEDPEAAQDIKLVFINNVKGLIEKTGMTTQEIRTIFSDGPKVNVYTIITGMYNDLVGNYARELKLVNQIVNQALIITRLYDQEFAPTRTTSREPLLKPHEMYYFNNHQHTKLKAVSEE